MKYLDPTIESYSPWDQLPAPVPKETTYPLGHFYNYTAKHLIKDTVRVMDNGLHIDLDKVIELESILVEQLDEVADELAGNPYIQKYLEKFHKDKIKKYKEDRKSKIRDPSYYLADFKPKDMVHRSYFMSEYADSMGWSKPGEMLPTGVPKWPVKLVRKYAASNRLLQTLLDGSISKSTPTIAKAMQKLSEDKARLYNEKYLAQIKTPEVPYPKFNPGSPNQKQDLFDMLGLESEEVSKTTGLPSWDRPQVERVNKETTDKDIKHLTQCFIDYSFAAIVKNNFINAFYTYTIDGRLYGQYKLLGAKTG